MSYQIKLDQWFCLPVVDVRDGRAYFSDHGWEDLIIDGERVFMRPLDRTFSDRSVPALKLMKRGHVYRLKYMLRGEQVSWEYDLTVPEHYDTPGLQYHSYVECLVWEMGLNRSDDPNAPIEAVDAVIALNPPALADYRGGKKSAINSLLGMCMKQAKGLDARKVKERLVEVLG